MTLNLVKVSKASLLMCLKCPLCSNLVQEATTISECLHTFCRDCIYQELDEEENDCCPICNVYLGCSPLEKLRADRQLDDVCAKIFPSKPKKRKLVDEDADINSPAPAKRKERSLSSLGIGVPPAANPGFVKRRTKSVTRKPTAVTSRETSTDVDSEGKQSDAAKSEMDIESENNVNEQARDTASVGLGKTEETDLATKKEVLDDEKNTNEVKLSRQLEQLSSLRKVMPPKREQSVAKNDNVTAKMEINSVFETLKASAIGSYKGPGTAVSDQDRLVDVENCDIERRKIPASFAVVRERSAKGVKKRSALAKLAEIAVDQAVKERDPHMFHVPRAPRGRGALENCKPPEKVEQANENHQAKVQLMAAVNPVLQTRPLQPLFKSLSTTDKAPSVVHLPCQERRSTQDTKGPSPPLKQKERNSGFWFVLQAAESQTGGVPLPQLSAQYLRVKDGKLPLSIVKKYLVKKLHLNSEHEVDITCRGQPVVPNLPLESIRSMWFATMPPSASKRESSNAEHRSRREGYSLVDDLLMVLTYGRQNRLPT